ncbi:hypothetical protein MNEG_4532 [Monoraphidium neglectum]|uniref:Uncharacterized protein n=1 Tax=Monoraphidium neglectum TaxID=145388 RepID=A0A0D2MKE0_9CHLO|nr:hypothetical protein MNEG_4532 [Monoraphidium neglectum]KIZ03425.1 hypothetical protein MNEG_4532 [Monoraphidium neglectum]|eukprot:XP_013902444.1 hypothetical protein MNEG_4532 [Monoraphidium neglectum]
MAGLPLADPEQQVLDPSVLAAASVVDMHDTNGAAIAIDPGVLSAIVATGTLGCDSFIGPDGQHIQVVGEEELQQHLAQLAATGVYAVDGSDLVAPLQQQLAAHERAQMEGIRRGDTQALQSAKRAGTLITVNFTLELPPELEDLDLGDRSGIIEAPQSSDVAQLKRLFMYNAHNKLLPGLQMLITEDGCEMLDMDEEGNPVPISACGVTNGSKITLRIVFPDDLDTLPLVDEAIVSSAYSAGTLVQHMQGRQPGRKTRWTQEQIEALIEGVERHGLSAWRTIVQDVRLAGKNNMQCKDKFRNLCLTIIQGRPERGLTLDWRLKDRVRQLIEQENIKF